MMAGMYANHPIKVSVAGSVESISHITADTLYACHKAFYAPCNMTLCVAGNVDPERIAALAREILPEQPSSIALRDYGQQEPAQVNRSLVEERMEVSTPIFQLGFKGTPSARGLDELRQQLVGELASEALVGVSAPLYARLYQEGLINKNFGCGYENYPGCAFLYAGGESRDPAAVRDAILEEAKRLARDGVDETLFARLKKGVYGGKVRGLNSFENICVGQAQAHFAGYDFFDFAQCFASVEKKDVEDMLARWVREEFACLSVVLPKEG